MGHGDRLFPAFVLFWRFGCLALFCVAQYNDWHPPQYCHVKFVLGYLVLSQRRWKYH